MKQLEAYYKAIEDLTRAFCKKYFGNRYKYDVNDWVGGQVGGIININDYWFSLKNIEEAIKFKASKRQVFDYYDYCLENFGKNKPRVTFEIWLDYYNGFKGLKNEK